MVFISRPPLYSLLHLSSFFFMDQVQCSLSAHQETQCTIRPHYIVPRYVMYAPPSPMRSHGLLSTVLMPSMTTRSLFPPGPFHHMPLARFLTDSHCVPSWLDSLFRRSLRCDIALVTRWNPNTVLSCVGLAKNNISRPTDSGSKMSGPLDRR